MAGEVHFGELGSYRRSGLSMRVRGPGSSLIEPQLAKALSQSRARAPGGEACWGLAVRSKTLG